MTLLSDRIGSNVRDDLFQQRAGESLLAIDGADFIALAVRPSLDFLAFRVQSRSG